MIEDFQAAQKILRQNKKAYIFIEYYLEMVNRKWYSIGVSYFCICIRGQKVSLFAYGK